MAEDAERFSTGSLFYKQLEQHNHRVEATDGDVIQQAHELLQRGKLYFRYEKYPQAMEDFTAAMERYIIDPPGSHRLEMTQLALHIIATSQWVEVGPSTEVELRPLQNSEALSE